MGVFILGILLDVYIVKPYYSIYSKKSIYREANRKPSPKAEIGAKKLADMFEKMMR